MPNNIAFARNYTSVIDAPWHIWGHPPPTISFTERHELGWVPECKSFDDVQSAHP